MPRDVPQAPSASALDGFWFVFAHAGHRFSLWVSGVSAREEVYVDGELISQRRKIAVSSVHEVRIDGKVFRLELTTKSLRKGVFQCLLFEGKKPVSGLTTEYVAQRRLLQSGFTMATSAAIFYVTLRAGAPILVGIAGVVGALFLSHVLFGRSSGYTIRSINVDGLEGEGPNVR